MQKQNHRFFTCILDHFPQKKDEVLQAVSKFLQGMQSAEKCNELAMQAVLPRNQTSDQLQKTKKVFVGANAVISGQGALQLKDQGVLGTVVTNQIPNEVSCGTETENDGASMKSANAHNLRGLAARKNDAMDVDFLVKLEKEIDEKVDREGVPKKSSELEINGVERAKIGQTISTYLEQPHEDKIASMPQIHRLLDELRTIVTSPAMQMTPDIGLSQDSKAVTDLQHQWLVFIRNFLRNPTAGKLQHVDPDVKKESSIESNLWRLEQRAAAKDLELEQRFRAQGFDIGKLPPECFREPLKSEEERLTKELGSYGLISSTAVMVQAGSSSMNEGMGTWNSINADTVMDPGYSQIDDIDGDKFGSFEDAAWILLTSQRPASQASAASPNNDGAMAKKNLKDGTALAGGMSGKFAKTTSSSQILTCGGNNSQGSANQVNGEKASTRPTGGSRAISQQDAFNGLPFYASAAQSNQNTMLLPQKRYAHTACLIEDSRLFIYGGVHRKGSGQAPFHAFYECQLKLDSARGEDLFRWRKIQVETPKTRDSHSCVGFLDQHLLIFGGSCDSKSYNDLYKYTVGARLWTKLEPIVDEPNDMPCPREGHIAVLIESDKMVVHGGINSEQECFDDAFVLVGLHEEIDLTESQIKRDENGNVINALELKQLRGKHEMLRWIRCSQEGDVPTARDSHSATLFNGHVFIFGGQDKDERVLDDFYYFSMQQGSVVKEAVDLMTGLHTSYVDRTFKLTWTQIHYQSVRNGTSPGRWPTKRSSHTMSLFKNRFLVLVGGETTNDEGAEEKSKKSSSQKKRDSDSKLNEDDDEQGSDGSEEETANQSLADVWLFDLQLKTWFELKPSIRVQPIFNNKKMRKTFEPRMAHTATVVQGNYIVFFGGYCSQTSKYSHANFAVLSLMGCTDYILSKPNTMSMIRELFQKRQLLKLEKEQEKPAPLFAITGGNNASKQGRKMRKNPTALPVLTSSNLKAMLETATPSSHLKSSHKQRKQQNSVLDSISEIGIVKPTVSCGVQASLIQSTQLNGRLRLSSPKAAGRRVIDVSKLPCGQTHLVDHICLLLRHFEATYKRDYLTLNEEPDERPLLADRAEQLAIEIARVDKPNGLSVFRIDEKGRGMLFKDFMNFMQSAGFISLVKKLARCALVITKVERVSRKNNAGLQRVLTSKDREQADDVVIFEVHIGMVSFDFSTDSSQMSIPFVSYQLRRNEMTGSQELHELTPLADRFVNLILHYSGYFESTSELKRFLLETCFERNSFRPGTLIVFTSLLPDMKAVGETVKKSDMPGDIVCKGKSLHNAIQSQYIDFPEHLQLTLRCKTLKCNSAGANPFKFLLDKVNASVETQKYAIRGCSGKIQYWLIEEAKLRTLIREADLLRKFNGVLIFSHNEHVMTDIMCQPAGKRLLMEDDENEEELQVQMERIHGIVMIDNSCASAGLLEPLEIDQEILMDIRQEVWKAYFRWKLPLNEHQKRSGEQRKGQKQEVAQPQINSGDQNHQALKRPQPYYMQRQQVAEEPDEDEEGEDDEEQAMNEAYQAQILGQRYKRQKLYDAQHQYEQEMAAAVQLAAPQQHPLYAQYAQAQSMVDENDCQPIMLHQQPMMAAPSSCHTLDTDQRYYMLTPQATAIQQIQQPPPSPYLTKEQYFELSPEDQQQYYMQMTEYMQWVQQNEAAVAASNPEELGDASAYDQQPESEVPPEDYYAENIQQHQRLS